MNAKNFIVGGVIGGIADFLLGWLIWGILLDDMMPKPEGVDSENLLFIFLGCISFGFLISFIFSQGDGITKCIPGIKMGLGISLFMSLSINFFNNMYNEVIDLKMMGIDVVASLVVGVFVGAVVAVVNGKMK